MAQFLFLHGSWHGAWCWYKVLAQMAERGHQARAIDLPGRGRTPAAPALVGLKRMVDAAQKAFKAVGGMKKQGHDAFKAKKERGAGGGRGGRGR